MLNPQLQKCFELYEREIFSEIGDTIFYWIAGGTLRDYFINQKINYNIDIDVFFPDACSHDEAKKILLDQKYHIIYDSFFSLKMKKMNKVIDLVKIYYNNPQVAIENFDFTVCCAALSQDGFVQHEMFFLDLVTKNITINKIENPFNTLNRISKYIKKGFTIEPSELLKVISKIKNIPNEQIPDEYQYYFDINTNNSNEIRFGTGYGDLNRRNRINIVEPRDIVEQSLSPYREARPSRTISDNNIQRSIPFEFENTMIRNNFENTIIRNNRDENIAQEEIDNYNSLELPNIDINFATTRRESSN